jgi:hypothetical protein
MVPQVETNSGPYMLNDVLLTRTIVPIAPDASVLPLVSVIVHVPDVPRLPLFDAEKVMLAVTDRVPQMFHFRPLRRVRSLQSRAPVTLLQLVVGRLLFLM